MSNESAVLEVTAGSASGKKRTGKVLLVNPSGDTMFGDDHAVLCGNVRMYKGAGAPAASARATLSRNPAGDDNALTFTAVKYGAYGNGITIAYVDPAANSQSLAVSVSGKDITVSLATNGGGSITSTAAQIKTAIEASAAAAALVTCAVNTSDSGSADDGSGVVTALAAAAMTGGAGVGYIEGVGYADIGSGYIDVTNGNWYINAGTQAVPVWKLVTRAA